MHGVILAWVAAGEWGEVIATASSPLFPACNPLEHYNIA